MGLSVGTTHAGGVYGERGAVGAVNVGGAGGAAGVAGAGGYRAGYARTQGGANCCVAQGEDCTACGVGCGNGAGNGAMSYVGSGCGEYIQETTYKYIGAGGDFDVVRPRRDFTCLITTCCLLSLLLLIPLLCWLLSGLTTTLPFDCNEGFPAVWPQDKADYCCLTEAKGCATTVPTTAFPETTPTQPPTPFPTMPPTPPPTLPPTPGTTVSHGPVDPYNCAVDPESSWDEAKKEWCCRVHHLGCPPTAPPATLPPVVPTAPPPPADPFNCADGFANWVAGWSVEKKEWCCSFHGKGCPQQGGGCATSSEPYDCEAGFANWQQGWSVQKKAWCCSNKGKGCPPTAGGCA